MDRLIVLEQGRIVEQGSHAELLALGGHYAALWRHQSGGFLSEEVNDAALLEDGPVDEMRTSERPEPDVDAEPPGVRA
jgi:ATP-binding cassette subfamily B multidrug efflux pump